MELRAEAVSRRYLRQGREKNWFYAVERADLSLTPGTLTEITGRSGSGKTTLLHMLAGLLQPTEGRILLDGADFGALEDSGRSRLRGRHIGVIPQGHAALRSLTVLENVRLPSLLNPDGPCDDDRAEELLDLVGLAALRDAWPDELSGGELRRLSVARAMVLRPAFLLADEPTGDLDDDNTRLVLSLLREYADTGGAVLLVTHEAAAAAYADTLYSMSQGVLEKSLPL